MLSNLKRQKRLKGSHYQQKGPSHPFCPFCPFGLFGRPRHLYGPFGPYGPYGLFGPYRPKLLNLKWAVVVPCCGALLRGNVEKHGRGRLVAIITLITRYHTTPTPCDFVIL